MYNDGYIPNLDLGTVSTGLKGLGSLSSAFGGAGAIIGSLFNMASNITASINQSKQQEKEEERYNEAFNYQKELNSQAYNLALQNFGLQQDVYNYEKELQTSLFAREDNAVQRRALDLEKAGLSKTLAAGSAANAGSAINVTAPQNNYNPNEISVFSALMDAYNQSRQVSSLMALQEAQTSQAYAEARKINADASVQESTGLKSSLTDILYKESVISVNSAQVDKIHTEIKKISSDIDLNSANIGRIFKEYQLTDVQIEKIVSEIKLNLTENKYYNQLSENEKARLVSIQLSWISSCLDMQSTSLSNQQKAHDLDFWRGVGLPVLSSLPTYSFSAQGLSFGASYSGPIISPDSYTSFVNSVSSMSPEKINEVWEQINNSDNGGYVYSDYPSYWRNNNINNKK